MVIIVYIIINIILIIPDGVRVNLTGKAIRSSKDKLGHSYLKLVEHKCKGFIGDAKGQLVDSSANPENNNFGEASHFL